jgi:hypothetical protein
MQLFLLIPQKAGRCCFLANTWGINIWSPGIILLATDLHIRHAMRKGQVGLLCGNLTCPGYGKSPPKNW